MSVCHLPGKVNIEAVTLSRSTNIDLEWKFNTTVFHEINSLYGPHDIDLFASRINHQLPRYVSYLADPNAEFVDAFSLKWVHINGFAFPPFSIVGKVVQKLIAEETELTLIAPLWTTQHWFPKMLHHIVQDSFNIPSQKSQPLPTQPTNPQMKLSFRTITRSFRHYLFILKNFNTDNIGRISQNGVHFAVNDKLIYLRQLKWI